MLKLLFCAIMIVGTASQSALAAVTVKLSGSVYHHSGDAAAVFPLGTTATAWFRYDSASPGRAWYPGGVLDPSVFFYENAPLGGGMRVGSYRVRFSNSARMFVTDQEQASYGLIDRVIFSDHDPIGGSIAGRPIDAVGISWQDNSATALSGMALPTDPAIFAALGAPRASIDWTPYIGAQHRVSVIFDKVSVSAAPEPASWAMMIGGFGVVGGALRRRRVAVRSVRYA